MGRLGHLTCCPILMMRSGYAVCQSSARRRQATVSLRMLTKFTTYAMVGSKDKTMQAIWDTRRA